MICDPTVEVCCDACSESVYVELKYKYKNYSRQYCISDDAIEEDLRDKYEWFTENGKHYCCESCKDEKE